MEFKEENFERRREIKEYVPITTLSVKKNKDHHTYPFVVSKPEGYEEKVNRNLLRRLIGDEMDYIEIMNNSINENREVTEGTLADYWYLCYSQENIPNRTQIERKFYLKQLENYLKNLRKPNVANGINSYFAKRELLQLPYIFWQLPQIFYRRYSDELIWKIPKEEALKFLSRTNIFELQKKGSNELQYTSGVFMDETDGKFYLLHSNKINSNTQELIMPQITPVMKLKDRIKVLECN